MPLMICSILLIGEDNFYLLISSNEYKRKKNQLRNTEKMNQIIARYSTEIQF